jgi:Leucine-rich repeat (LRR) protein
MGVIYFLLPSVLLFCVRLVLSGDCLFPENEYLYLQDLFSSTHGNSWKNNSNWNFANLHLYNPCLQQWYGISANCSSLPSGTTSISLANNSLLGSLPTSLTNFSILTSFIVSRNRLRGFLPKFQNNPSLVRVNLSYNIFNHTIPTDFFDTESAQNLEYLSLRRNWLHGIVPDVLYSLFLKIKVFDIGLNYFRGNISSNIKYWEDLQSLHVEVNDLTGTIPSSLFTLYSLTVLDLGENSFEGSLSPDIAKLTNLQRLFLLDNRFIGRLPSSLFSLYSLTWLDVSYNHFDGSLSSEIAQLTNLVSLHLRNNRFTGIFPSVIPLKQLQQLAISHNSFHGDSFLSDMCQLPSLLSVDTYLNSFSSSFPSSCECNNLTSMILTHNLFNGSIPAYLSNFTHLEIVGLHHNSFTGSLPVLQRSPNLYLVDYSENFFNGSIPNRLVNSNISKKLFYLSVGDNLLTGKVPSDWNYPLLIVMIVDNNHITGTLPSYLCKSRRLSYIDVSNNVFFGTLSTCFSSSLNLLDVFIADTNHFSGTFPFATFLSELEQLYLDHNSFSGSLVGIDFKHLFPRLQAIAFGYNAFTGSFPVSIFSCPTIGMISATQNCFSGSINDELCSDLTRTLEIINLDGLRAAPQCAQKIAYLESYYSLRMRGTVPSCLWKLPKLQDLFMSGNGFEGSLPAQAALARAFRTLSLSHNLFTGTIPNVFLQHSFEYFDLSSNKFKGSIEAANDSTLFLIKATNGSGFWNISNNRLSGSVPEAFEGADNIDMLFGNVFACCDNLPESDPHYNNYFCGSSELDNANYAMAGSVFLVILLTTRLWFLFRRKSRKDSNNSYLTKDPQGVLSLLRNLLLTLTFRKNIFRCEHLDKYPFQHREILERFFETLDFIVQLMFLMLVLVFVFLFPLILILNTTNESYRKYEVEYNWIQTTAYLTGVVPASLFLAFVFAIGLILTISIALLNPSEMLLKKRTVIRLFRSIAKKIYNLWEYSLEFFQFVRNTMDSMYNEPTEPRTTAVTLDDKNSSTRKGFARKREIFFFASFTVLLLLTNIGVSLFVNFCYLRILNEYKFSIKLTIQLAMAVFKLIWNWIAVSAPIALLANKLHIHDLNHKFHWKIPLFQTTLLVINSIVAPCLAAIVTDESCFEELFVHPLTITEFDTSFDDSPSAKIKDYFSRDFDFNSTTTSPGGGTTFQLPFIYYFNCGSQILTSFLPIFLYIYAIFPLRILTEYLLYTRVDISHRLWGFSYIKYCLKYLISGVMRLEDYAEFPVLVNGREIISSILLDVFVLMTFGLNCPILAFLIIFVIFLYCVYWKYLILRFVKYHSEREFELMDIFDIRQSTETRHEGDEEMKRLALVNASLQEDEWKYLYHSRWRILYACVMINMLFCTDMVGDENGITAAIYVFVTIICLIIIIRLGLDDLLIFVMKYFVKEKKPFRSQSGNFVLQTVNNPVLMNIEEDGKQQDVEE